MKKSYLVSLDEEKVEDIKVWLKDQGLSFSGYLNVIINEIWGAKKRIIEQPSYESTVNECHKMFNETVERIEEVKRETRKATRKIKGKKK